MPARFEPAEAKRMRAHQIMTRSVVTVSPETELAEAAKIMLQRHISGLPVTDNGSLVGIVSESDLLRRTELGTQRKRPRWLQYLLSPSRAAADFVHERGRKVKDVMTAEPVTADEDTPLADLVGLMERNGIKRLPVLRDGKLVGIVTRANLIQAAASMAREIPDPTADDDHIRDRITRTITATDWCPLGLQVTVRNGVVHLSGLIVNDNSRRASIVAAENTSGVKEVHDHLCFVDTWSGFYVESPEDIKAAS
jgi:CBS domain-containing protein